MVAAKYETYLRAHTKQVRHSGRDFFEHLKGTHDLLCDWGNPEYLCLAGLFHSIYGTQFFKHKTLSLDQRSELAALIGDKAEHLAYLFCTKDRRTFTDPDLLEIEAANLIEQRGLSEGMRRKLLKSNISPAAKLAVAVAI
jgi:(p)ppGpp synthase/HD superfamily hydrolase